MVNGQYFEAHICLKVQIKAVCNRALTTSFYNITESRYYSQPGCNWSQYCTIIRNQGRKVNGYVFVC